MKQSDDNTLLLVLVGWVTVRFVLSSSTPCIGITRRRCGKKTKFRAINYSTGVPAL